MASYRLALGLLATACQFRSGLQGTSDGAGGDSGGGSGSDARRAIDASNEPNVIYAIDNTTLYTIDITAQTVTTVGLLVDSMNNAISGMDSLAYVNGSLVAVTAQGPTQSFAAIDPTTALVTVSTQPALNPNRQYYGLTYDTTSQELLATGTDTKTLYRGDSTANTMTAIGTFNLGGVTVYGDIAWLDGVLYATMYMAPCAPTCIATIDPSTGAATILSMNAPSALPSLSGFHGKLYAMSGGGDVFQIDTGTGAATFLFNADNLDLGDSAP